MTMGAADTDHTVDDCSGTFALKIGRTNKILVVMYSVSYSHNFYANCCGVGIFVIGDTENYLYENVQ